MGQSLSLKAVPHEDPDFADADAYFNTLASLSRLLHDPSMKKALAELDDDREITLGELIGFMQTYMSPDSRFCRLGPDTRFCRVEWARS
jgi:hypothetical protein